MRRHPRRCRAGSLGLGIARTVGSMLARAWPQGILRATFSLRGARPMTTCLVVDDDPELRALVADHLARFGIRSRLAADARGMRREVEHGGIDLVLLDLMLPDGNGIELCKELRERSHLPVIMLTAQGD